MQISYRAIFVGLAKPKTYAKQPPDSKYLHVKLINREAAKWEI